jgi:hypothetical protein
MGPHMTDLHSPVLDEGKNGPPLDRTVIEYGFDHGPVHDHGSIRDGLNRTFHFKTLCPVHLGPLLGKKKEKKRKRYTKGHRIIKFGGNSGMIQLCIH